MKLGYMVGYVQQVIEDYVDRYQRVTVWCLSYIYRIVNWMFC